MSGLNPTELKRRRRAAARTLLSDPRGTSVAKKRHLVDGVWVDKPPFNAEWLRPRPAARRGTVAARWRRPS